MMTFLGRSNFFIFSVEKLCCTNKFYKVGSWNLPKDCKVLNSTQGFHFKGLKGLRGFHLEGFHLEGFHLEGFHLEGFHSPDVEERGDESSEVVADEDDSLAVELALLLQRPVDGQVHVVDPDL